MPNVLTILSVKLASQTSHCTHSVVGVFQFLIQLGTTSAKPSSLNAYPKGLPYSKQTSSGPRYIVHHAMLQTLPDPEGDDQGIPRHANRKYAKHVAQWTPRPDDAMPIAWTGGQKSSIVVELSHVCSKKAHFFHTYKCEQVCCSENACSFDRG